MDGGISLATCAQHALGGKSAIACEALASHTSRCNRDPMPATTNGSHPLVKLGACEPLSSQRPAVSPQSPLHAPSHSLPVHCTTVPPTMLPPLASPVTVARSPALLPVLWISASMLSWLTVSSSWNLGR
eukprot:6192012-Amphidinium_carterae.1